MAAANHRKAVGRTEIARRGQFADRLLAGVDQIGINFVLIGKWSDAQHPVLALQRDLDAGRNMVGDQRRNPDPQIDIIAIVQFLRRPGGHFIASPGHIHPSFSSAVAVVASVASTSGGGARNQPLSNIDSSMIAPSGSRK